MKKGENSFIFTGLSGGEDHQNWQSFLWVPPMYFDENKELQPGVFNKWESNSDFTEWTFNIDSRAKFSDGTKLTAQDAKDTWEAMANPDSRNGRIVGYIGNVQGFADAREKKTDKKDWQKDWQKDTRKETHTQTHTHTYTLRLAKRNTGRETKREGKIRKRRGGERLRK